MKVSLNCKTDKFKSPKFTGFEIKKNDYGERYYEWSYPYDQNRYDCYLEVYPVLPDKNGDYDKNSFNDKYRNIFNGKDSIKLNPGPNNIDLDYIFARNENAPFAYHYSLIPKSNPGAIPIYKTDAGDLVDVRTSERGDRIYNIVLPENNMSAKAGAAILIGADNYDVRYIYDKNGNIVLNPNAEKDLNVFKNFANHVGGSLAGVHQALKDGRLDLYDRIFLLPHASGDRLSSAGYWLESGFQYAAAANNNDTFSKFQKDLFVKGKNLVADSALTSEGMSGIHIQSILQHGADDVFFDWFKCASLKDMSAKIGVFGKKSGSIRHKLVNPPEIPVQQNSGQITWIKNKNYEKDELTYVQVFNSDETTPEQAKDIDSLIEKYERPNGSNPLKYGTHNDTIITYAYPVKFSTYKENIENLNELNKSLIKSGKKYIPLDSYEGTRIVTKFEGFDFENKIDGGFYTWDANSDIAKFDYAASNEDVEEGMHMSEIDRRAFFDKKIQKRCEVLDYATSSLKYWTRKTNQTLNLYVAQVLKNIDTKNAENAYQTINNEIDNRHLPQKLKDSFSKDIVENIINGDYTLHGTDSSDSYNEAILRGLMDYPLESTEFGKDILSLFSTPYITNRATKPEYIGKSRFDLFKENNPHLTEQYSDVYNVSTAMYTKDMFEFASDILNIVNEKLPDDKKLSDANNQTDYGKYVLPIITPYIAKFAVVKGLFPDSKYKLNSDGDNISYDYEALRKKSLKGLGIYPSSQKGEALDLLSKMRNGIKNIPQADKEKFAGYLYDIIKDTNLNSFKMAEMIIDRTKSGIDWRIDAAKDFANMDGLRNGADTFEDNWERVVYVLKTFSNSIHKENPNSYIVAEVTDEVDLHRLGDGYHSNRFVWRRGSHDGNFEYRNDIVRKVLRETGIDAVANYADYFTPISAIFGKKGDDGGDWGENQDTRMYNIFRRAYDDLAQDFLFSGPYNSILKSYTFADNHDKPRVNHTLSLDAGLFFANLNNSLTAEEQSYRRRAFQVLNPNIEANDYNVNNFDFSSVSAMAAARGEAMNSAIYRSLDVLSKQKNSTGNTIIPEESKQEIFDGFRKIVADMASGKYRGVHYEADNFGIEEVHKIIQLVIDEYVDRFQNRPLNINKEIKEHLFAETFKQALDPALNNSLGIDKFLISSPGIPTIYAGDDLGSTGFDRKSRNAYVKCRSAVHHDWVDKFDFIKQRQEQKNAVTLLRSRPVLHALNDGAPFLLKLQETDKNKVTGLFRYSTDGNAVLSLFNTSGITHTFDRYTDPANNPVSLRNNRIDLSFNNVMTEGKDGVWYNDKDFTGLHCGLTPGMEFINANDPNDKYYVFNEGGDDNYYLAKNRECSEPITLTDSILTLYSASEELKQKDREFLEKVREAKANKVSFCGTYANNSYSTTATNCSENPKNTIGSKLNLISK